MSSAPSSSTPSLTMNQNCPLACLQQVGFLHALFLPVSPACYLGKFEGPWFTTQILLSSTIGLSSFLIFSYCRRRWPLIFAPRTMLKGTSLAFLLHPRNSSPPDFSPHEAHAQQAFFGWIIPTLKVSEYTVLQIVGLDAAVVSSLNNV